MPFFERAEGVNINGTKMTDVKGNMYHYDHSQHVSNANSNNTTTHNTTNSHNDTSRGEYSTQIQYNNNTDSGTSNGLVLTTVQGKPRTPVQSENRRERSLPQRQRLTEAKAYSSEDIFHKNNADKESEEVREQLKNTYNPQNRKYAAQSGPDLKLPV